MFNHPDIPDKWLKNEKQINKVISKSCAGFTEYIRWMRSLLPDDDKSNNETKLQVLQLAVDKANNYRDQLKKYNQRTKLIAQQKGAVFEAECLWRVRVGGEAGAENILLPAFDSLGIPYIPSASLRGVARSQAFWEIRQKIIHDVTEKSGTITNKQIEEAKRKAELEVSRYFGALDTPEKHDRMGKVIFLDAYPLYNKWGVNGRKLALDMANNIWEWKNNQPNYSPNPNIFLSLKKPIFLIGLRPNYRCNDDIFKKVTGWLIRGLENGIGSQINSGYGEMSIKNPPPNEPLLSCLEVTLKPFLEPFLKVEFTLTGQLIHGVQRYKNIKNPYIEDKNGKPKSDTYAESEVRAIAFKSMLRYWFKTLALGYLSSEDVQKWEAKLFGGIESPTQKQGWIKCQMDEIYTPKKEQEQNQPCLTQKGILKLNYSRKIIELDTSEQKITTKLMLNLTWLMFHLGGVGLGARRPKHERNRNPYYRGCNLKVNNKDQLWAIPETIELFQEKCQKKLENFYSCLGTLIKTPIKTEEPIPNPPIGNMSWVEAIDANCKIIVCSGEEENNKPYALSKLHCDKLNPYKPRYNSELCGKSGDYPSGVWIRDLEKYQVVTVFGANEDKREQFLDELKASTTADSYHQIFPL